MIGIPLGNFECDLETLKLNIRAKPYYAWASICTPYPGTELYEVAKKEGLIKEGYEDNLEETYHLKSNLDIPDDYKVNILHKIFAVVVEYTDLYPIIKQPEFYKDASEERVRELKKVFDSFKEYKYDKLHHPEIEVAPEVVTNFVNQTLNELGEIRL